MRTKKKTVEQEKNRNSQKSVKSVRLMGMGVYGGKDFWKRYVFSLEWKSEGVMDDDSEDGYRLHGPQTTDMARAIRQSREIWWAQDSE